MSETNGIATVKNSCAVTVGEPDKFGRRTIGGVVNGIEHHRDMFNPDSAADCDTFADTFRANAPYDFVTWACRKAADLNDDQYVTEREAPFRKWVRTRILEKLSNSAAGIDADNSTFPMRSCTDLAATDFKIKYAIEQILVVGQPMLFCGPRKGLKTSLLLELAFCLATGLDFLGRFKVAEAVRVAIFSGESGLATLWETLQRIAESYGFNATDAGTAIQFCELLPQLNDPSSLRRLARTAKELEATIVIVDPAYQAMPGGDAGNLFAQGALLRGLNETCSEVGATAILAHHLKKGIVDPFAPPELDDIAWAGFQEFARQWILTGRRRLYVPGSGEHKLWLNVGGSAGHNSLWALDVSEGAYAPGTPRVWHTNLSTADEARSEAKDAEQAKKDASQQDRIDRNKKAIVAAAIKLPDRQGTMSDIRARSGVNGQQFSIALAELLGSGDFEAVDIVKKNKQTYEGYRLVVRS